jgi:uncharacterized surface protein with fasciclin (FAS1) repeats
MDDAFGKLPDGTVDTRKTGEQGRIDLHLTYHVLSGKIMSTDLSDGMKAKTLNKEVTIHLKEGKVFINDAEVLADVKRIMELYMPSIR